MPSVFRTLSDLIAAFAARGNRTAVIAFGATTIEVSYAALATAIEHAAGIFHEAGIGRGDRVALLAPNGIDWITAYFGVIGAGGTVMPLDYQATNTSLLGALEHIPARILLTTQDRATHFTGNSTIRVLALDEPGPNGWAAKLGRANEHFAVPGRAATDLASILFTSGTTGKPKAVPLTDANLCSNANALLAERLIGRDDRVLLPLPLHHTYPFTVGLLTTLGVGGTIILPAGISGPEISGAAKEGGATALLAVPRLCTALLGSVEATAKARGPAVEALFRTLLKISIALCRATGWRIGKLLFPAVHERLGRRLSLIGSGGAKLPREVALKLEGLGWQVLTGYGLTETSPVLTFNSRRHSRLGSEGRVLPGVELRIASSETGRGEIEARGAGVFAGYWENDAATAAAFTEDGWFKTGDLGELDRDGYLYVVGRSKELLVLADGKKLFPETLEQQYAESPLIRELAIFEHEGQLAALIVPDEQAVRERGALREAQLIREEIEDIGGRLPPYQRLSIYRLSREALPRTHLGKLKRHLVPELFRGITQQSPAKSEAEAVELDSALAREVWCWLKKRFPDQPLSLNTSPQLDLKVDSLEWVSLTTEIERRFAVVLTGDALARILSLKDLLREIENASGAPSPVGPTFVPPGPLLRLLGVVLLAVLRPFARFAWRLETKGLEQLPGGAAWLVTPNHASYLDPVCLAAALPWSRLRHTYWAGWVGVVYNSPLRRLLSRALNVFPIDPDRGLATAVDTARDLLNRGNTVVWFPEGRRSPTGELGNFRPGVGLLPEGTQAAVVPTAIVGSFTAWPKHRRWPKISPIEVRFGAPRTIASGGQHDPTLESHDLERAVRDLLTQPAPED